MALRRRQAQQQYGAANDDEEDSAMSSKLLPVDQEHTRETNRNRKSRKRRRQETAIAAAASRRPPTAAELLALYEQRAKYHADRFPSLRNGMIATFFVCLLLTLVLRQVTVTYMADHYQRHRVVVALSTRLERIQFIEPTLRSVIQRQKQKPDMVYLTLLPSSESSMNKKNETSAVEPHSLPDFIHRYVQQKKLYIIEAETDYGPISKLLYALEMESYDTRIIVVHDNIVYKPALIRQLYRKAAQYPDSVVTFSGANLRSNFRHVKYYVRALQNDMFPNLFVQLSGVATGEGNANDRTKGQTAGQEDRRVDLVHTLGGICVQRRFFDIPQLREWLSRNDLPESVVHHSDDFLLSAHLTLQRVNMMLLGSIGSQSEGLFPFGVNQRIPELITASITATTTPTQRPTSDSDALAIQAAFWLQKELHVWNEFAFMDWNGLTQQQQDAIYCEGGAADSFARKFCFDGYEQVLNNLSRSR